MEDEGREEMAQWLREASRGDQEAWRHIIEEVSPKVFGLLRSRCKDPELAEELTQSTFATIAEKLTSYVEQGHFESWVFRIAINRLRDEMRRRGRHATPVSHETMASLDLAGGESRGYRTIEDTDRRRLEAALAGLSAPDREIIDLRFIAGLSFAQIAALLEEPIGTLLARHHRALAKLRVAIERMTKGVQ